MPVAIARREIHLRIGVARIVAKRVFDHAHRLDEFAPVHRRQVTQATDAVADRYLIGGLLLVLGLHQLFDGLARFAQPLLDPCQRQRQGRTVSLQPARKFGHERAGLRRLRTRHVGDHQHQVLRVGLGDLGHPVGPFVGHVAIDAIHDHACADTTQVFDQREPQHDRNRPQLAERERRDRLIRRDETAEAFSIHAAVAVRDRLQRDVVDARETRRWPIAESRQLAAVVFRQMPLGGTNLFFDQVIVVEQPFACGREPSARRHRLGQQVAGLHQQLFVR